MILEYSQKYKVQLNVDVWYSGEELCAYLEQGNAMDMLFIDVELLPTDGISIGNYIRKQLGNYDCEIVFFSNTSNRVMELFKIHTFGFMLKPLKRVEVFDIMNEYMKNKERQPLNFVYCKRNSVYNKVAFKDIIYFRSNNKIINIVTKDKILQFNGQIKKIIKYTPTNFLLIHQSFLVNMDYIVEINNFKTVKLQDGTILNISRAKRKTVKEYMINYRRN